MSPLSASFTKRCSAGRRKFAKKECSIGQIPESFSAAIQPAQHIVPRTLVVAGGLVIGLLAGVFLAAFLNQIGGGAPGHRDSRDLYEHAEVFNLATVSRKAIGAASRADSSNNSVRVDGLAELPAVLIQALERSPGAILIVGTGGPAASCGFTVALARQFSQQGLQALTVDATDTRLITKLFGLEGKPGFFDAMRSAVALKELEMTVQGLQVLPAGVRSTSVLQARCRRRTVARWHIAND